VTERVLTATDVEALATRIMAPRPKPLVVVSTDPRTGLVVLDLGELEDELADIAELVVIPTGERTRELETLLPARTHAYGGAGRSYPADFSANSDWRRSHLRFPGPRATQQLIGDVLGHAGAAGLFTKPSARRVAASGVVKGFVADDTRALVELDGRGHATITRELTYPPAPLSWSVHTGQRVTGTLDLDTRLLLVGLPTPAPERLHEAFPHGCVTLALARKVTEARAWLQLHPNAEFVLRRADVSSNPLDTVDLLVAEGDVIAARVSHLSDGSLHLRLTDVDDDEPLVPSLALTDGGRPWLAEGRPLELQTTDAASDLAAFDESVGAREAESAAVPAGLGEGVVAAHAGAVRRPMPGPGTRHIEVAVPPANASPVVTPVTSPEPPPRVVAGPGTALQSTQLQLAAERARSAELERRLVEAGADDGGLSRLRATVGGLEARLRVELAERGALENELKALKEQQRATTRAVREARRIAPPPAAPDRSDRRARWATADEWVRHEVLLSWVERVEPTERDLWPIPEYAIGPAFAASLLLLDEGQFDKAMKAVVDAVTGRIREIAGRDLHPLRTGDGGADADTVRGDGAKCMRASIEQHTPAARRLHYWTLPGGRVELSRVVRHDDTRP
jgi:hypothetical protein